MDWDDLWLSKDNHTIQARHKVILRFQVVDGYMAVRGYFK